MTSSFSHAYTASASTATGESKLQPIMIGAGSPEGVYYAVSAAICSLLNPSGEFNGVNCRTNETGGSLFNLDALRSGKLQFAVVQGNLVANSYRAEYWFKDKPFIDVRPLFTLHVEPLTLVTRKDSGIKSFDDLENKNVNLGFSGSGTQMTVREYLQHADLASDFFKRTFHFSVLEQAKALCRGDIDAFLYQEGHPSVNIQYPTAVCEARLVPISGPVVDELVGSKDYYSKYMIPGGLYQNNPDDIATYGTEAMFVTSAAMPEEQAYAITKLVFENLDTIKNFHPALLYLNSKKMVQNHIAPLHPGAIRYFQEIKLIP